MPSYSWAEEPSLFSRMFKYWTLIMKFQIDYLVSIRSMREDNFIFFDKILISLVKWFFIFDQYNYVRWLSVNIQDLVSLPIHALKSIKNLKEEILWFRFRVVSFNESITTSPTRQVYQRTNRFRELWKRWVTEQVGDRRAQIAEYLKQLESKIPKGTNQNDPRNHEHNPVHNV